jgi:Cys-tRNA(Pro)/Cys-tRNA(Cys) deacylase
VAGKPLAVRLLEQRKIAHEVYEFDATIRAADDVALHTGVDPALVFKTLVVEQDPAKGKPYLVMMPSTREIDLKRFAANIGVKKLRMASHRDAEGYTGLQVGGISALALLGKGFPVYIEVEALRHPQILVSAGQRGMDVRLAVDDLLAITGATPVRAARERLEQ